MKFELKDLKRRLNSIPKAKKIVFVSGSYDLIHTGHINFLNLCKKQGDILVVGVNSDEMIKKEKGLKRPIETELNRAYCISNLKCVDIVYIKRKSFIVEGIDLIKPNKIIFCRERGVDFTKYEKIIEKYCVGYPNTKCVILERKSAGTNKGSSTTKIINKILKRYK